MSQLPMIWTYIDYKNPRLWKRVRVNTIDDRFIAYRTIFGYWKKDNGHWQAIEKGDSWRALTSGEK